MHNTYPSIAYYLEIMGPLYRYHIYININIKRQSIKQYNDMPHLQYLQTYIQRKEMPRLNNPYPIIFTFILLTSLASASRIEWGIYNWVENQTLINAPLQQNMISLSHPHYPYLYVCVSTETGKDDKIKQLYNGYNVSQYRVGKEGRIQVVVADGKVGFGIRKVKSVKIQVVCGREECKESKIVIDKQLESVTSQNKQCVYQSQHLICVPTQPTHITLPLLSSPSSPSPLPTFQTQLKSFQSSLLHFSSIYNISSTSTYLDILQYAISQSINSICVYRPAKATQFYLGYCEQVEKHGIKQDTKKKWVYDFRLAPFTMFLLADVVYELAETVYHHYFDLFQTALLYPLDGDMEVVPLPQHIQVFTRFGTILQLQNQVQLLNSMFVKPMLSQLGTLHQQLNYRQAKKLHPLLLKMLRQKWQSQSQLHSYKSLYSQSFTPDFRYHEYGQKLQQSLTKISYIYKIIDTFTSLQIKFKSLFMPVEQIKEHLQEHFTLMNIIRVYAGEDSGVKAGKYRDIIDVGGDLMLYGKYVGYQAILPYVYGLGKTYPQSAIKQLETEHGLKSSSQQPEPSPKSYKYRGNIHSYFNLKILTGIVYKFNEDKSIADTRRKQVISHMQKIASSIGRKVLKDYKENQEIYTSWGSNGKGIESNAWGKIVTALFLRWV